ncbi:MAG: YitT family protein [Sulfuricurvum sp.]
MLARLANIPLHSELKNYLLVFIGALSLASGVALFLLPSHIVAGGTPGISILLNYFTGVPAGMLMFMINIPLVLLSMKFISRGFAYRTVFSIAVSAATVDLLREYWQVEAWSNDPILASVFGGIAIGLGLGFMIAGNASAGGPSIIARYVADRMQWKQNTLIVAFDVTIVIVAGIAFARAESALLSLMSVYATGRSLNALISGRPDQKVVHVFSQRIDALRNELVRSMGKEGIVIEETLPSREERQSILILILEANKIRLLRELVKEHDPDGFLVVIDASELH